MYTGGEVLKKRKVFGQRRKLKSACHRTHRTENYIARLHLFYQNCVSRFGRGTDLI